MSKVLTMLIIVSSVLLGLVIHMNAERNTYRTRAYILEAMFMYGCMKGGDAEESCTTQLANIYTAMWP